VVAPVAVTVFASAVVAVTGIRGADYPGHLLRAQLWKRAGLGVWNYYWYGGHPTPNYSVLVPPLVAAVGAVTVCAIASIVGTYTFARLLHELAPADTPQLARTLAGMAFAASAIVNVIVGRTTFAVGLAVALLALAAWHSGRVGLAALFAVVTPLASPVAAAFLAIAAAAVGLDAWLGRDGGRNRRRFVEAIVVAVLTMAPLGAMSVLYPASGRFPFRGDQLVFSLVLIGVAAALDANRVVRIGLALAAASSLALFVVPNPLGGNFLRFTQFVVIPVAVLGAGSVRRQLAPVAWGLLAAGTIWSAQYGIVATVNWAGDDSVEASYHEPLVGEILLRNTDSKPVGRVEIPFTDNHWESYFVASEVPYARGWERQLDLDRNPELYDPELTRAEYHDWLHHNGVRWVAVPDVELDEGGRPEAEILESWQSIGWLELVWWNADWRLYEVTDYLPVVDQPARLVAQRPDELVIATREAAVVTLRYGYSDELSISGEACLIPHDHDGWMTAYLPGPGQYHITADPEALIPGVDADTCRALVDASGPGAGS